MWLHDTVVPGINVLEGIIAQPGDFSIVSSQPGFDIVRCRWWPCLNHVFRRVYFKDLLVYERRRDATRRKTLEKLMKQVDDAGLYDAAYTDENDSD